MLRPMTEDHLTALLTTAEAKKDDKGFLKAAEGRYLSLHVASSGASLTVSKIEAVKTDKHLIHARTVRGEIFVLALEDIFAGSVEQPPNAGRKAGFG
jgi:hypothetical protein